MCGINGIWDYENKFDGQTLVAKMNQSLIHRGPDFQEVKPFDEVTFGHTRLAIIDLDSRSNQPMTSADGNLILTYNGEIYNYKKCNKVLKFNFTFS